MLRLAAIDPDGLTDAEKTSRELLLRQLTEDQEAAEFKEWEMPVNQMGGIYAEYPQLVAQLSFTEVKDYDDWIARLRALPNAFDQVTTNMSIGMDDHRVPPKYLLEKALEQVKQLANQKPEDSPLADAAQEVSGLRLRSPSRSASGRRCWRSSESRSCRPTPLRPFHRGQLHSRGPH